MTFGFGLGNFAEILPIVVAGRKWKYLHNEQLLCWLETC